jgi:hypothetical protein
MRVFLLHSDDKFTGSWMHEHWDSVIDLGRAPKSFYEEQSAALGCPVFSIFDLALEVEDLRAWRPLLAPGMGRVVDRFGIDWWDVISLMLYSELQQTRLALRLADRLRTCQTLVASRPSVTAQVLQRELGIPVQVRSQGLLKRIGGGIRRRGAAAMNLTTGQILQVVYDKYDPKYRWRKSIARSPTKSSESAVLLPSAYLNVTKTALNYAKMLPDQNFLLVLARESAAVSPVPANVETARLASFASQKCDRKELKKLEEDWLQMENLQEQDPVLSLAAELGILKKGIRWLRWGIGIRDAWLRVFELRSLTGCLSADDSNPYTRIPLLMAKQREIPAVACHHGALDCFMALKNPRFSSYLAKGEMERDYLQRICGVDSHVVVGAPSQPRVITSMWRESAPWITFFTEPYETDLWRVEAIYREVLPRLCAITRRAGKSLVLKLHPFESLRQRQRLVARVLTADEQKLVTVTDTPLSRQILEQTWCAVTVESTVASECASVGIPAFLCGWLRHAYAGYAPQYARFGAGRMLNFPDELLHIPDILIEATPAQNTDSRLVQPISPSVLSEVLSGPQQKASER